MQEQGYIQAVRHAKSLFEGSWRDLNWPKIQEAIQACFQELQALRQSSHSEHKQTIEGALKLVNETVASQQPEPSRIDNEQDRHHQSATEGERQQAIQQTRWRSETKNHIQFCDIFGADEAKQALREAIVLPKLLPALFTGVRQPWRKILLYGPPGTGKTMIAKASEMSADFFFVSSADIISSWMGESEKMVRDLFQTARRQTSTSVVFMDEVDSLCRRRHEKEDDAGRRVKTELLHQLELQDDSQMVFLCATNCPWELDSAFLRRFEKLIYVGLPSKHSRREMMQNFVKTIKHNIAPAGFELIAERTELYSGSDLRRLATDACLQPLREAEQSETWVECADGWTPRDHTSVSIHNLQVQSCRLEQLAQAHQNIIVRAVVEQDFLEAAGKNKPSSCKSDIGRFQSFQTPNA